MKAKIAWWLFLLAGVLTAAGCGGAPAGIITAEPGTSTPVLPSSEVHTLTPSPSPVGRVEVSPTGSATSSKTSSPEPSATATPPGLALFRQTAVSAGGESTDGQWLFQIESGQDGFWSTHLAKKDGSQEWSLRINPLDYPSGIFDRLYLVPIFWLPKEPYVFLAGVYHGDCGQETFSLRRLNLKSGLMTTLIRGSVCSPIKVSFSNTGRYLLSNMNGDSLVRLQRLSDGNVTLVRLPGDVNFYQSYTTSWSPDETRVVLDACQARVDRPGRCISRPLVWIDAENGVFHPLLPDLTALQEDEADYWVGIFWLSANRISIHMQSGLAWEVSLVTGQLVCHDEHGRACPPRPQPTATQSP